MNRKVISTIGIIICAIVGYWAWTNLGGGEGNMRNVLRNSVVGAVVPLGLYSALMLLASFSTTDSSSKNGKSNIQDSDQAD